MATLLSEVRNFAALGELRDFYLQCGGRDKVLVWTLCHRDSDALNRSNGAAIRKRIPEGPDVLYGRSSHWAAGWVEELYVRVGSESAKELEKIELELQDYPILDESLYWEIEYEDSLECLWCELPHGYPIQSIQGREAEIAEYLRDRGAEYSNEWHIRDGLMEEALEHFGITQD